MRERIEQVITLRNGHSEIAGAPLRPISELVPLAAKVVALAREDGSCLSRGQLPVLEGLTHDMRWVARNVYNAPSLLINCETDVISQDSIDQTMKWVDEFTRPRGGEKGLVVVNSIDSFLPRPGENENSSSAHARSRIAEEIGRVIASCTSAVVVGTTTKPYIHQNPLVSAFATRYELPLIPKPEIIEVPEIELPAPVISAQVGSSALSAVAA